ncbi:ste23-metalloprotease involved in a-factor processing [Malassezia pachydermatis]|uniref:Ste23-metalloprotease involved in a-factor processing n=1 Tax=Malassezia pachydermatis TaxID=77020 RepID=A0A0M8MXH7_9BASI|nr:ste23-metalloprotease involved in a-factor processing [Malassezia pachydermatis]KOS15541.1 ste23-metalloprotease involved in a-factor processing [Malassezia pachydermatis]
MPLSVREFATVTAPPLGASASSTKFVPHHMKMDDDSDVTFYVYEGAMEKPKTDQREYRLVRLANDLEVLVISDPTTDKASAAMDVRVGHLSDPSELQGMAHFCEHLLFMGTKKYPRENEYSEYLSNHSGSSNAFTSLENTNYFFDVGHAHFEGALDRFAQFFLEPLFDPSCSEREIRAVDSEHKKNLQSDMWRAFQLEKSLCDPSHPYSKFGTGNITTLWDEPRAHGLDIRDELLKFHAKYYSANMMKLVVLGRESPEQLMRWVVEKFSQVPNKGCDAPSFPGSPLGPSQLGTEVIFRTIKDVHLLDITFPFPEQVHLYLSKPGQLLSHFIGHEGDGSLFSCLKQRGWANSLSAGSSINAEGFELFKIHIDLTTEGYTRYEDVAAAVFQYLDLLRSQPVQEWMYEEVRRLSELRFEFKEKSSPAMYGSTLASQMQHGLPPAWLLSGPYVLREFDAPLIQATLESLRPEHCRLMLAGREPPAGVALDQKEQWYGTEYTIRPLPPRILEAEATLDGMAMPHANQFIPQNLDVASSDRPDDVPAADRPQLLTRTPLSRLWHKQDDRFFLPKANVALLLRTPNVNASPRTAVLSRLYVELVKDALCEFSYDADVAGLHYNIDSQMDGIDVILGGYNDKLPQLLHAVLDTMKGLRVDEKRFLIIKEQVRRNYENFDVEEPYQHAAYYSSYLLTEHMWTQHDKLKVISSITAKDVQTYQAELLSALHAEMLVHGNMSASVAHSLLADVESRLDFKALPVHLTVPPRSLILPPGHRVAWHLPVANAGNVNSSLEYYCQVGDPTDVRKRTMLALLAQIAHEPCFDQLRTKEQLGYLVFSGVRTSVGQMGFRVIVQSERSSTYLESRIDAFFEQLLQQMRRMTDAEFEAHVRSLLHKRQETVKNLAEETMRFWQSIHSGYYDFLHRERDVAVLPTLTKDDMIAFMEHYIHPSSPHRAKTVTHLDAQTEPGTSSTPLSPEAWQAFFAYVEDHGMAVPAEAREGLQAQVTSVESLRSFVQQAFAQGEMPATLQEADLMRVVELAAAEHPVSSSDTTATTTALPPAPNDVLKAEEVRDVQTFKQRLQPSVDAAPVLPWSAYEQEPHTRVDASQYGAPLDAAPTPMRANI